ncbi:MAG: hypothetical protein GF320_05575, partial [Armatimonadia bacterium]|nr:hypothetical protein [Armatimonadia bacterium]
MAYKISKVRAFDKKVADAPGEMAKALAPITAGRLNLLGVWGWTEGKSATIRICMQRVTPKQLSIINEAGFTEVPGTVVSIQCDNKPGVAQTIGAATGEADASMEAFTGLAIGKQGATLAFFDDDKAADKAIKAVKGSEKKVSSAKKKSEKKKSAAKKKAAKKKAA